MNMEEYKAVQVLKAKGMRQETAVKKVLSNRRKDNEFKTLIRKRD